MFHSEVSIRVRYSETDRMGYVYHGNYASYFEVARVEALRQVGFSYKEIEDNGIMLPVLEIQMKYFKPALYDDLLKIKLSITQLPSTRLYFEYETYNENNELLNKASTVLVFVSKATMRPIQAPDFFVNAFKKFFE